MPTNGRMDKEDVRYIYIYIYTHTHTHMQTHTHTHTNTHTHTMEYYSAIKKNKILPFEATWMDLENIILCEVGQTNIIFYNLYMESKKYEKLVNIIKKQTHRYREQTSGYQWGERRVEG